MTLRRALKQWVRWQSGYAGGVKFLTRRFDSGPDLTMDEAWQMRT